MKRGKLIYFDTNLFVYHLQSNPHYSDQIDSIFKSLTKADVKAATSVISLGEVLSSKALEPIVESIKDFFSRSRIL